MSQRVLQACGWILVIAGVLLVLAWGRSYLIRDWVDLRGGYITSESGYLVVSVSAPSELRFHRVASRAITLPREYVNQELSRIGSTGSAFRAGFGAGKLWNEVPIVVFPYYVPVVACTLAAALMLWLAARLQHRARRSAGLCERCGYDLRASSNRCPECGAGIAHPGAAGTTGPM